MGLEHRAETGDLWVGNVGQIWFEEVDLSESDSGRGANFGRSVEDGAHEVHGPGLGKGGAPDLDLELPDLGPPPGDLRGPVLEFPLDATACSVIGGFVYRGSALPDLVGTDVYYDLCGQRLLTLSPSEDGWAPGELDATVPAGVVAIGELHLVSIDTGIYELTSPA